MFTYDSKGNRNDGNYHDSDSLRIAKLFKKILNKQSSNIEIYKEYKRILNSWYIKNSHVNFYKAMKVYIKILEYVFYNKYDYIDFDYLINIDNTINKEILFQFIFYLINNEELLYIRYYFVDNLNNKWYNISYDTIKSIHEKNIFYHPEYNCSIKSFKKNIFCKFYPTKKLIKLKCVSF